MFQKKINWEEPSLSVVAWITLTNYSYNFLKENPIFMIMIHRPISYSYIHVFLPFKLLLFSWPNRLPFEVAIWGCVLLLKLTYFGPTVQDPKHVPIYFSRAMIKGAPPPQCYDNTLPPPTPLCYSTPPHCPSLLFHSTSSVSNTGERGISMDFCPKFLENINLI